MKPNMIEFIEDPTVYEGVYSASEINLNKRLYEACSQKTVDLAEVESLLAQGADPLGGTAVSGWGLVNHVYSDLISESQDNDSIDLPALTKLFLRFGMNVDDPRIPYDQANSLNPLWSFAFVPSQNAIVALKMLLDHGLSAESFGLFWGHAVNDIYFASIDPHDPFALEWNTWTLKMMLLGASYDSIAREDTDLMEFIGCGYNQYDLCLFRDWDRYAYEFDTSDCDQSPCFFGSTVHIYDNQSGYEVWQIKIAP